MCERKRNQNNPFTKSQFPFFCVIHFKSNPNFSSHDFIFGVFWIETNDILLIQFYSYSQFFCFHNIFVCIYLLMVRNTNEHLLWLESQKQKWPKSLFSLFLSLLFGSRKKKVFTFTSVIANKQTTINIPQHFPFPFLL